MVAVPVAARSTCEELKEEVDEVVCAVTPAPFYGVGQWYENFSQTSDEEVKELLDRAFDAYHGARAPSAARKRTITVDLSAATLVADLEVPLRAWGLVLFAHGSGSSRLSPRNQHVATLLREEGLATLLIDLLTIEEAVLDNRTMQFRFDVELLAQRLIGVTDWRTQDMEVAQLPLGYFGASTGSAAALIAAASRPSDVEAVVSRGGRPDLAASSLARVHAPTLLIVGGEDGAVIELNQSAFDRISVAKELISSPAQRTCLKSPERWNAWRVWPSRGIGGISLETALRGSTMEAQERETTKEPDADILKAEQIKQVKKNGEALIKEVELNNQNIQNPQERRKVVRSKPC